MYTKHVVGKMVDLIQRCIICGEVICDYTHSARPKQQGTPPGYEEGNVYVSTGNPRHYASELMAPKEFVNCKP